MALVGHDLHWRARHEVSDATEIRWPDCREGVIAAKRGNRCEGDRECRAADEGGEIRGGEDGGGVG